MDLKNKLQTTTKNQQASIQNLEAKFDRLADKQSGRPYGSLPSNTQPNPTGSSSKPYQPPQARNEHANVVFTLSGKSYDLPYNPNDQQNDSETPINFDSDDEDDEPTPQPKPKTPKPVKETPIPKPYKQKIPYHQRLRKENMEAQYGKFLDIIRAVQTNVPLVDVLAGIPNYGKFLKELVNNKHKIEQILAAFLSDESSAILQNKVPPKIGDPESFLIPCNFNKDFSCNALADIGASINLMPYSLYAKLSLKTLKPTKMSVRLADRSYQYPVGIAENMLVEVGKFTFPVDFVIIEMEEDSKVPLILGRHFLHTADAVIRVKQKQLNLRVGTERIIFHIDSAMKHSYSNDDTCFSIDVIDEILEEDFDALLDEGSEILYSIEGTIIEEKLFAKFDEFMAMTADENSKFESESDTKEPPFEKITFNTDYKIKIYIEEPPTDLELKPLKDNLEYVFLEEPSFLPVIISSQLSEENKNKLVSVLIRHKQAFAWKTTDIPKICPSFCLEVDKAKIDVISKLPRPTNIEGIRSFQGHAGFYRRFIKVFSKISSPLTKLLEKDTPPNWSLPFELMCDASDFTVGAILDRKDTENVAADHLSRIENEETSGDSEVDDNFPGESLMEINIEDNPWFTDFVNYLASDIIPKGMTYRQKKKKFSDIKQYFREEPYLFKVCSDETIMPFRNAQISHKRPRNSFLQQDNGKNYERYRVNHRFSTSYHPQTSGQVENTNRALKRILEKTVKNNSAIWSRKLDDALWAFRTAYKIPTGTTPYKIIYGKNCHFPFEIEHHAYWALKNCNPDLIAAGEKRMFQLHELDELRHQAYENSRLYKARTKVWHDRKLKIRKEFKHGNKVLLFHSKYKFKQPKLGSRWLGPYVVKHQYPSGYVELYGIDGKTFIVNGHRLKLYHEEEDCNDRREAVTPFFPKE
ncbi:reverse transcriptase domain-containing protein [Tanacetum coccineum]